MNPIHSHYPSIAFGKIYQGQSSIKKLQGRVLQSKLENDIEQNVKLAKQNGLNYKSPVIDTDSIEKHIEAQATDIDNTYSQLLKHSFNLTDEEVKRFNAENPEYASIYFHVNKDGKVDINGERKLFTFTGKEMQALKTFIEQQTQQNKTD